LWTLGEGNVKEVRGILTEHRELAYTTVMTLLDRLVRRGAAARRKSGRSFVYIPMVARDSLRTAAVKQLVDSLFDGSRDTLLAYLQNGHHSSIVAVDGADADSTAVSLPVDDEGLDTALL
jgi:predicted transcriptional regulator